MTASCRRARTGRPKSGRLGTDAYGLRFLRTLGDLSAFALFPLPWVAIGSWDVFLNHIITLYILYVSPSISWLISNPDPGLKKGICECGIAVLYE